MCIKSMGQETFTGKLFELAKSRPTGGFVVNMDGPYGQPLCLDGHDTVLLLAGGIGITTVHSTFRMLAQLAQKREGPSLKQLARVELVWASRSVELFGILLESLKQCLRGLLEDGPV